MELIRHSKFRIIVCFVCIGLFFAGTLQIRRVSAQEQVPSDSDPNSPAKTESDKPGTSNPKNDPNEPTDNPTETNEEDSFNPKLSTLILIQESWDRIFAPELITDKGLVKYDTLNRKPQDMVQVQRELKTLHPLITLKVMSKEEKIAFWINTYNYCILQLIIDNYPIQPKWYNIMHPDNSILQIPGAWDKVYFWISEEQLSLKEIEQEYLLERYNDPRICFALSDSSISGAILRNEPFKAQKLDQQLDEQVRRYLATDKGIRIDREKKILYLSNLFQVHKATFLASDYTSIKRFRERKAEEQAWLNFIEAYCTEEQALFLSSGDFTVKFIDHQWDLNETK